ncbi:hypothetical protein [Streptomyces sp. CAU 1734]|uniref:hypothetical protein n=1 Tax=Streptomyces sp. CAU 1734 TaxID=3140360 RepID=UPI003261B344
MPTHQQPVSGAIRAAGPGVESAEAALVEHYPRLVRLAYLTLPPSPDRHQRVLAAHAVVQRALPRGRGGGRTAPLPGQRGTESPGYLWVRRRVLRAALRRERRRLPGRAGVPRLPAVLGLRLFPGAGGTEEFALDRELAGVPAAARAAFALTVLDGVRAPWARELLRDAGAKDPEGALRTAERLRRTLGERAEVLLRSGEFDPCTVRTRPTDLLRRRHRARALAAGAVLALAAAVVPAVLGGGSGSDTARSAHRVPGGGALARALDPALLERAPDGEWADTSRVDLSVWPPRGGRTGDRALLERALRTWARPGKGVRVSAAADTSGAPPGRPPRLLYAGEADGAAVVLLHDGERVVRYAEPVSRGGPAALDLARMENADVTTAAALVLTRTARGTRYLLAPWIGSAALRDLLRPGDPARPLALTPRGVTPVVPAPAGGSCGSRPALQLRSSERIVENHAFLLTDLGDLAPVHLTWTPPPGAGAPARRPREAVSPAALRGWARTACLLRTLEGSGVRAVNDWAFAEQRLPQRAGRATWVCTRAETWRGPGRALVRFQDPAQSAGDPGTVVAGARATAACGRFGQHVLASTRWRAPSGDWFLLAAGSRAVVRIDAEGEVSAAREGTTMAVRAPRDARVELSAGLRSGERLPALR